jgi:hypothetical protein
MHGGLGCENFPDGGGKGKFFALWVDSKKKKKTKLFGEDNYFETAF